MYTLIDQKKLQIQRELRMIIKTEDTFNKKTNTTGVLCSLCLWIEFVELQLVHEHKIYISYTEQRIEHDIPLFLSYPENSFTIMVITLKRIRGSLKNWQAYISPITCPLREFLCGPVISANVHPLRARNRSSFKIANAFAKSRKPSSNVQNPIFCHKHKGLVTP